MVVPGHNPRRRYASLAARSHEDHNHSPFAPEGARDETSSGEEALGSVVLSLVVMGAIHLASLHLDALFSIKYLPLGAG